MRLEDRYHGRNTRNHGHGVVTYSFSCFVKPASRVKFASYDFPSSINQFDRERSTHSVTISSQIVHELSRGTRHLGVVVVIANVNEPRSRVNSRQR